MIMELQLTACELHCTMSFCMYNVKLFAFFEQCTDLYINSRGCSSETPKKSHQWAVVMPKFLKCHHFSHHSYQNSKKYGTMLYHKANSFILDMLHLTPYKYCSLVQHSKGTIENSEICESNPSEQVRGDIMQEACYTSVSE